MSNHNNPIITGFLAINSIPFRLELNGQDKENELGP
jgi:hypothetical protein